MSDAELSPRQRANVGLVENGFAAFNAGDFEATLGFIDPEVEIFTSQGLINAGTYHGHDGFMEWARRWLEAWESFENAIEAVHPVGESHVVVDVHQTGRGAGSGIEVEMDVAYLFELDGGRAIRVHLYDVRESAFDAATRLSGDSGA